MSRNFVTAEAAAMSGFYGIKGEMFNRHGSIGSWEIPSSFRFLYWTDADHIAAKIREHLIENDNKLPNLCDRDFYEGRLIPEDQWKAHLQAKAERLAESA